MNIGSKKRSISMIDKGTGDFNEFINLEEPYLSGDKKEDSKKVIDQVTGSSNQFEGLIEKVYPFERYNVKVILTPFNEFVGISEISINKEFLTHKQKMQIKGYHDVEKYYYDE